MDSEKDLTIAECLENIDDDFPKPVDVIDWKNKYLYLAAEFDNYKKHKEAAFSNSLEYKERDIISNLLEILDDFDRALDHDKDNQGLHIIYDKFKSVLTNYGLSEITIEVGEPFDDTRMDCIYAMNFNNSSLNNTVSSVTRKGYKYKDVIIRFAEVVIYKFNE